jgi:hypothetical protein
MNHAHSVSPSGSRPRVFQANAALAARGFPAPVFLVPGYKKV